MPIDKDERGAVIARCTLAGPLTTAWPRILRPL
jgi:hypothetical protein